MANSAGVLRFAEVGGDYVRPGIMLYGSSPFPYDTAEMLGLTPVMTLRSEMIAIQDLKANDSVGYGGGYTAARAHRIGVIACGYADGYPRHAPNGTPVLVCGKKVRTAGRVSMDMMTVDLTDVPEAALGSPVGAVGRRPVGRRRRRRGEHRRLRAAVRGRAARAVRDAPKSARSTSSCENFRVDSADVTVYIVVTGAAGFIGSNLVKALNARGENAHHRGRQPRAAATSSAISSTATSPTTSTRTNFLRRLRRR